MECKKCGKFINPDKYDLDNYAYKIHGRYHKLYYYCSWKCMRSDNPERAKRRVGDTRWL